MLIEVVYTVFLVGAHIGTECADMSQLITIDTGSGSLQWIMLVIGSQSVIRGSCGCFRSWEVHWCVQRWIVILDGICPGNLVASVSGLIRFPPLEGPSVEGFRHIVHFHLNCVFGFNNRNSLRGLRCCWGLFGKDCQKVYHNWHLL